MNKKKLIIIIAAAVVALLIGGGVMLYLYYSGHTYTGYNILTTTKRADSNTVSYLEYEGKLLKYSRDGASALDADGTVIWNGGYEMERPQADACGDYVVVGDIDAKQFYVFNGSDSGTRVTTALPIVEIKVTNVGVVAALLQDEDSNVINVYNPYSTATPTVVEIPTNVAGDGYPVDFDISPDGNSLITAMMKVENGVADNKVSLYNFTEVGQEKNQLVGGRSFGESMVAHVEFVSDNRAVILYDGGYSVFENMKQPEETVNHTFAKEMRSVLYNNNYIGAVVDLDDEKRQLQLFDYKDREEVTTTIDFDYSKALLVDDDIIFYNQNQVRILRLNGTWKFNCKLDRSIGYFFKGSGSSHYFIVDENNIEQIRLSGG